MIEALPLYEYECPKDGRFERIRKFSDPPLLTCPTCGQPVEKLLSSPAIQFKGTGWYVTDYAKKSNGGGGEPKGDAKKDSAPATSKTTKDSGASASPASGGDPAKSGS